MIPELYETAVAMVWSDKEVHYSIEDDQNRFLLMTRSPTAWEMANAQLVRLELIKDDWNGEGARAPSRQLLESVRHLLHRHRAKKFPAPSRVVPIDGGVIIDWQIAPVFATLEVTRPYEGDWLIERPGKPPVFETENWEPVTRPQREHGRRVEWSASTSIASEGEAPVRERSTLSSL